ncbi:MAG: hypothetical protein MJ071_02980 [Oscillospiraceae bacterium]|nr:hypothetical protein [Oscillospiraceae bacterium]
MKELVFQLPDELVDKFELTVQLTGSNRNALAEGMVRNYLAAALQNAADSFRTPEQAGAQTAPPVQPAAPQQPRTNAFQSTERTENRAFPRTDFFQEWGKANKRIPRWARNPQQNNHKILRAFFELKQELGNVTLDALRRRCSDPTGHPNTFVPHFDNNFSQMKFDNGNSHGKVFEERNGMITIWDTISDTLQKYRDYFE